MKSRRVRTAMVGVVWVLGVAWSPARSGGQCCGDCDGSGKVAINELVTAVNRALDGCQADGVCDASVATCNGSLTAC